jgi:hypothetical protein
MSKNIIIESFQSQQTAIEHAMGFRRPYVKPLLKKLGDLRSLTLGSSQDGFKDSSGGLFSEDFSKAFSSKIPNPGGLQIPNDSPKIRTSYPKK